MHHMRSSLSALGLSIRVIYANKYKKETNNMINIKNKYKNIAEKYNKTSYRLLTITANGSNSYTKYDNSNAMYAKQSMIRKYNHWKYNTVETETKYQD